MIHLDLSSTSLIFTAPLTSALPLHSSQDEEEVHDAYSIFSYRLQLNYELVHELLAFGDSVTVLEPAELRLMVTEALRAALANYDS